MHNKPIKWKIIYTFVTVYRLGESKQTNRQNGRDQKEDASDEAGEGQRP